MSPSKTLDASEANLAKHNETNLPFDHLADNLPVPAFNTLASFPMDPVAQASADQNNAVIRRYVPPFQQITGHASNAKLYSYDSAAADLGGSPWKECDVAGPLFVIQLAGTGTDTTPRAAIFIINRKSLENFVLQIHPEGDIGMEGEFIFLGKQRFPQDCIQSARQCMFLYSTNKPETGSDTWGIWIFNEGTAEGEREKCFKVLSMCDVILKTHYNIRVETSMNTHLDKKVKQWQCDVGETPASPNEETSPPGSQGSGDGDVGSTGSSLSEKSEMTPSQGPLSDDADYPLSSDAASTVITQIPRRRSL